MTFEELAKGAANISILGVGRVPPLLQAEVEGRELLAGGQGVALTVTDAGSARRFLVLIYPAENVID